MTAIVALALTAQAPAATPAPPPDRTAATAVREADDNLAALAAAIRALPGHAGFGVYALERGRPPRVLIAVDAQRVAPIGSALKLWVLAEAVRQVRDGTRRWRAVVTLGPRALPTGQMQAWLPCAPVTLQTLATMMVAISDNTAADTLVATLGRAHVDAAVAMTGTADPAPTLPLLTTREAAAIKADPSLTTAWTRGSLAQRHALLAAHAARFAAAALDPALFDGPPRAAETVEWFASPADMARTLDWLRLHGDAAARTMLAINPGLPRSIAMQFGYAGYKGGSEPGVIAMNHLLATRDGRWFALSGNWHRQDAGIDEARFAALMARAAAQLAGPIPPAPRPMP